MKIMYFQMDRDILGNTIRTIGIRYDPLALKREDWRRWWWNRVTERTQQQTFHISNNGINNSLIVSTGSPLKTVSIHWRSCRWSDGNNLARRHDSFRARQKCRNRKLQTEDLYKHDSNVHTNIHSRMHAFVKKHHYFNWIHFCCFVGHLLCGDLFPLSPWIMQLANIKDLPL